MTIRLFPLLLCLGAAAAQQKPTVSFELNFPGSEPEHYLISVESDCRATYASNGKLTAQAQGDDTFHYEFTVSRGPCEQIFELAKRANFFVGQIDSKKKNIASTGSKVLSYQDSARNTKATYNYSRLPAVQELTEIFQGIGATVECGHRLEYDHHYQKLALDEELKRMERSAPVIEVSSIEPTLQKIVDDPLLMTVVRARAQRLLATAKK